MLSDITTIELSGAFFPATTSFDFFKGNNDKIVNSALVYGRNGTGKSTIARAFRKIAGEDIPIISSAFLCDKNSSPVMLSEEEKKHIYVFDEDYINKNVRFQEDHLETIIMLGKAADLSKKIEVAEKERKEAERRFKEQEKIFQEYNDSENPKSPAYYLDAIMKDLRGDDNWAGRERVIRKSGRNNSSVTAETYKRFVNRNPQKSRSDLIVDFRSKMMILEKAESENAIIENSVPSLPESYLLYDDKVIQNLLAEKIEKPELNERERKLLTIKADELGKRLDLFRKDDTTECPYCFQPLSHEYKETIVASIEKVLNKTVEDHQKELQKHVVAMFVLNFDSFKTLNNYQKCVELAEKIKNTISANNENLNKKNENPFESISIESNVALLVSQLKTALELLERERMDNNETMIRKDKIREDLTNINNDIAYYDIKNHVEQMKKQEEIFNVAKTQFDNSKKDLDNKKKEYEDLNAQRRSIKLAVDSMNACLKYIFFSDDRLQIECVGGCYKLLSHGKNVKPCDISVGERNIIGLSYFFTSLFEGKDEKNAYKENYLIVIDDPISSFDTENRIGIMSFLNYKLGLFLEENPNSKALLMTHDLMAFYDIHKIVKGIVGTCKTVFPQTKFCYNTFEIKDSKAFNIKIEDMRQEYTELVKNIYDYACDKPNAKQYDLFIGNMMRQILEAFSTFMYRKGIEDVCTDSKILELLPDQRYKLYYRNLMCRLVLNGGSHRREQVQTMQDLHFFNRISKEEKQRTAKEILCFIFLLNERHLLEHLEEHDNNSAVELRKWCQDIK
jgi:energy-coupling factor transporter ATP-binding protein EcfA2